MSEPGDPSRFAQAEVLASDLAGMLDRKELQELVHPQRARELVVADGAPADRERSVKTGAPRCDGDPVEASDPDWASPPQRRCDRLEPAQRFGSPPSPAGPLAWHPP